MNYSVFKLQNQAGRPAIFWEKETIPKKDRKFGYKKSDQRFPLRRFPNDRHHVETDMVALTPDEPPPPPKPAKNFILRNKKKVASQKEPPSTVTLTQEQLNAILRSVGKVAGGSENAVKITVDKHNDTKEITVESPRRHDRDDEDDDDYDDRKERRRKKKSHRKEEDQNHSIYSLMEGKSKAKASSDNESVNSDDSLELRRLTKKYKRRKDRKSRRQEEDEDEDDHRVSDKNRRNKDIDINDDDNLREKRNRRNRGETLQDEIDREIAELRKVNKSKIKDIDNDSDYEKENRRRRQRSKHRDSDDEDADRSYERKERLKKRDHSKERKGKKSRNKSEERDLDIHNSSYNKEEEELLPSPRDKIGLPMDLSWRHMTKAERRRLEMARQKVIDEEERKEEERIKKLNAQYDPEESFKKPPQRHPPTRSDPPATRLARYDRGRDTENSNYTDGNRHGRVSRSPSDQRSPDRSPDLPSYTTPDTSPKAPVGVSRRHMTLAEKKRLEWEKDRVESVALERAVNNDPWGRPGAGAPIRTRSGHVVADYKGRQVRKASYAGKVMMMY